MENTRWVHGEWPGISRENLAAVLGFEVVEAALADEPELEPEEPEQIERDIADYLGILGG